MSHMFKFASISATAISLAMPASAQVTADQVWADWQALMADYGMTTSVGTATQSGEMLKVTDFIASMKFPDGSYIQTVPEITFQNLGNGTVAITISPEYPVIFRADQGKDTAVEVKLRVQTDAMTTIASGSPETTQYDITAGALKVLVDEMTAEGAKIPMVLDFAMQDITGQYVIDGQETREIRQKFDARSMTFDVSFEDPKDGGKIQASALIKDLTSQSVTTMLAAGLGVDMAAALRDGASIDGAFEHGEMTYKVDADVDGEQFAMSGVAASGALGFSMGAGGLSYSASTDDYSMTMSGSEIPFPQIDVSVAKSEMELSMPVMKSEAPGDFRLAMNMTDFSISEDIWGMFDPSGQLPRDPATISFALDGQARLFVDILDPAQVEEMGEDAPGEINTVALSDLIISALGAKLTGAGAFSFDNSDTTTFDGMPAPTGSVDLKLVGANGLIDKLVALGFVQDEQAMGARMMLGLFARPADGPDTLTSKIEVNGDGSIAANGQRLR